MKQLFLLGACAAAFSCIDAADAQPIQVNVSLTQNLKNQFNVPAERNLFRAASVLATMGATAYLKSGFDGYSKALMLSTGTLLALAPILRNVNQPSQLQQLNQQGQGEANNQDSIEAGDNLVAGICASLFLGAGIFSSSDNARHALVRPLLFSMATLLTGCANYYSNSTIKRKLIFGTMALGGFAATLHSGRDVVATLFPGFYNLVALYAQSAGQMSNASQAVAPVPEVSGDNVGPVVVPVVHVVNEIPAEKIVPVVSGAATPVEAVQAPSIFARITNFIKRPTAYVS